MIHVYMSVKEMRNKIKNYIRCLLLRKTSFISQFQRLKRYNRWELSEDCLKAFHDPAKLVLAVVDFKVDCVVVVVGDLALLDVEDVEYLTHHNASTPNFLKDIVIERFIVLFPQVWQDHLESFSQLCVDFRLIVFYFGHYRFIIILTYIHHQAFKPQFGTITSLSSFLFQLYHPPVLHSDSIEASRLDVLAP